MKQLVILILLSVAGYFAYQHFMAPSPSDAPREAESEVIPPEALPPLPEACQGLDEQYENGIYGHATGQASVAQRNRAYRILVSCLKEEGWSEAEIRGMLAKIEHKVDRYLGRDPD